MNVPNADVAVANRTDIFLPSNEDFVLFFDRENLFHLTGAKNINNILVFYDYETGSGGGGVPSGLNTQLQYNNSGIFGGITGATTDGSTVTLITPSLGTPSVLIGTNISGIANNLTAGNTNKILNNNIPVNSTGVLTNDGTGVLTWSVISSGNTNQIFTSQTTVTITHNYNIYPKVQVIDSNGYVIQPLNIRHTSVNTFTVTFSNLTSGNIIY